MLQCPISRNANDYVHKLDKNKHVCVRWFDNFNMLTLIDGVEILTRSSKVSNCASSVKIRPKIVRNVSRSPKFQSLT